MCEPFYRIMLEFFGKKHKKKLKKEISSTSNDGGESPTQRLRFGNRGQTCVRPSIEEKPKNLTIFKKPVAERLSASPPTPLRFQKKPGLMISDKSHQQQCRNEQRKKLGKRRSDLGASPDSISKILDGTEEMNDYGTDPMLIALTPFGSKLFGQSMCFCSFFQFMNFFYIQITQ